jgi:hypothetical protein
MDMKDSAVKKTANHFNESQTMLTHIYNHFPLNSLYYIKTINTLYT